MIALSSVRPLFAAGDDAAAPGPARPDRLPPPPVNAFVCIANEDFDDDGAALLELARARYSAEDALIRETGTTKMAASGATLTFEAPQTEGSKKLDGCEILVADWSRASIDATRIEFGEVDRPGSYFYFTEGASPLPKTVRRKSAEEVEDAGETARYLWYHHAPNAATVLILR